MTEELTRALSFIGVWVICFIIWMVVEFFIDQWVIKKILKDSTGVMDQAIKDKFEINKLRNEADKLKAELCHTKFHSDVHTQSMIQGLQEKISKLEKLLDKYRKEIPICELFKKDILKLRSKGLTSDEIWEKIWVSWSTIRKSWTKWSV